jgi:GTPase SAR1 family protein
MVATKVELNRKACDLTGRLGSLYDARTDSFIKHPPLLQQPALEINKKAKRECNKWWFKEFNDGEIPLNKLNVEDELCLSLYLDMCDTDLYGRASLVKYEKPIDQLTLFLLYSYTAHKQTLPENNYSLPNLFPNGTFSELNKKVTHIVHKILWGFELLFVIQVPSTIEEAEDNNDIDRLIRKICDILERRASVKNQLTTNDLNLWAKLNVYLPTTSPFISFDQTTDLEVIIKKIQRLEDSWYGYQYPLIYILKPVEWIFNNKLDTNYEYFESSYPKESKKIQRQLFLLENALNKLKALFLPVQKWDKENHLLRQTADIKNKLYQLQHKKGELHHNLRRILMDVRYGRQHLHALFKKIQDRQYDSLRLSAIDPLIEKCEGLYNKTLLIDQLRQENFGYLQITDGESSSKKEQILKLFGNSIHTIHILCSSDVLMKRNKTLWNSYRQELVKKRNEDSTVRLIYADLSYCKHEDVKETIIISCDSQTTRSISSPIQQIPEKKDINVLLLGESGVGKSTFINAFVNYLTFDSLEQAVTGKPVVLIPVSFLITVTDKLEEFVVKFGDVDVNEDHNHSGQSVTQYCRSYVFDISNKLRLRLIDTPGIGDTRGLDQDQKNIDHILSYVNNFTHINAVCILLQPNVIRLNAFFRSCVLQLFTYLTPAARDNIVFCFTNTRATFFAPGNTAPLLKSFLKELPISDIPFSRKNSFCFDSESFRYLAAVKNGINFNESERQNFDKTWATSVSESERLLTFIYKLKPYYMSQWQSEIHAKLEIYTVIRPLMETFRKVILTLVLQEQKQNKTFIKLTPKPIVNPCAICYKGECKVKIPRCDILGIIQYPIHPLNKTENDLSQKCVRCPCSLDKHMIVNYELNYDFLQITEPTIPINRDNINWYMIRCLEFTCFIDSPDPFIFHFDRFIQDEEIFVSLNQEKNNSKYSGNIRMHEILVDMKKHFIEMVQRKDTQRKPDLVQIYQAITASISEPDIKSQINAIKQGRSTMLENEEYHIPKPSRSTGFLYRITEQ